MMGYFAAAEQYLAELEGVPFNVDALFECRSLHMRPNELS